METARDNHSRFGRPMDRERGGHGGGGHLFVVRREGDFERGFLSEKGRDNNFLAFRPSNMFMRILGDDALRLNDALFGFRGQAVEQLMVLDDQGLQELYAELEKRFEVVRDRLMALTDYCNKGFDGLFDDALEMAEGWHGEGSDDADESPAGTTAFGPSGPDVYEAVRQRNLAEGVLTDAGERGGVRCLPVLPVLRARRGRDRLHPQRRPAAGRGPHAAIYRRRPGGACPAVLRRPDARHEAAAGRAAGGG